MKTGDIYRSDSQADIWRGRYRLIEKVKGQPGTWITETLPDDDEIIDAIVDYWAGQEAQGAPTSPVWDKTWAECDEGEHPQRIGCKTHEQMMTEELERRAYWYGKRRTVRFISRARYDEYF